MTKDKEKGRKIGLTSRPQLKLSPRLLSRNPLFSRQPGPPLARWKKEVVISRACPRRPFIITEITKRRAKTKMTMKGDDDYNDGAMMMMTVN